ncbi:MAG: hypothetical protein ACE5GN_08055, partial [Waddliaceae bacterium]
MDELKKKGMTEAEKGIFTKKTSPLLAKTISFTLLSPILVPLIMVKSAIWGGSGIKGALKSYGKGCWQLGAKLGYHTARKIDKKGDQARRTPLFYKVFAEAERQFKKEGLGAFSRLASRLIDDSETNRQLFRKLESKTSFDFIKRFKDSETPEKEVRKFIDANGIRERLLDDDLNEFVKKLLEQERAETSTIDREAEDITDQATAGRLEAETKEEAS